jgi:hypothetical protein
VGLLSKKIYISMKFPQIYIIFDTWRECDSLHGPHRFNTWLQQWAIISIKNTK